MSSAARSLYVFGIYAIVVGAGLLLTPNLVLNALGFPPAPDGWVRVVGALAFFVGIYHTTAARNEFLPYIRVSVLARVGFAAILTTLVAFAQMPKPTLLLPAAEFVAAVWTWFALRASAVEPAHATAG